MKIASSQLTLSVLQQRSVSIEERSSLRMWDDRIGGKRAAARPLPATAPKTECVPAETAESADTVLADPKLRAMVRALEALTGRKIRIETFQAWTRSHDLTTPEPDTTETAPQREGWGIDFSYEKSTAVTQSLDFAAKGRVTLADGSRIDLAVAFSMTQESITRESLSFKAGDALIDPLVVNFDGGMLELGSVRRNFDLDRDGKLEEIAFAGSGSGFLALDKNGDGQINDGGELFGPTEGNGFTELAAYDGDGNGWIDEGDAIFEKLLIWTKDADGTETLYTLRDKGVGAIYLENLATAFDYGSSLDGYDGRLRATSLFLGENGGVGTVQEVDLKV